MKRLMAVLGMLIASSLLASPHGHPKAHKGASPHKSGSSHGTKSSSHMSHSQPSPGKSDSHSSLGKDFSSPKETASPDSGKRKTKQPHP